MLVGLISMSQTIGMAKAVLESSFDSHYYGPRYLGISDSYFYVIYVSSYLYSTTMDSHFSEADSQALPASEIALSKCFPAIRSAIEP